MKKLLLGLLFLGSIVAASAANFNYVHRSDGMKEIKFRVNGDSSEISNYNHVFLEVKDTNNNLVLVYDKRIYPYTPVLYTNRGTIDTGYTYRLYTIQGDIDKSGTCN